MHRAFPSSIGLALASQITRLSRRGLILAGGAAGIAAAFNAPLAGVVFVIVMEMTRDSAMALPLMTCSLIAYGLSRMICPRPIYKVLAAQFPKGSG